MNIQIGELYYIKKSGNQVKAIEPVGAHMPNQCWRVEQTDGESRGKQMIVQENSLVTNLDQS